MGADGQDLCTRKSAADALAHLGCGDPGVKRSGMANAEMRAMTYAAGVAQGTFHFGFPTKEHVLLELDVR